MHVTRASVVTPSSLSLPFRFPTRLDNGTRTVRVRRQSVSLVQFRPSRGTPARRSPTARLYRAAAGLNTIDDNEHATVPVGQPAHADARRSRRQPCSLFDGRRGQISISSTPHSARKNSKSCACPRDVRTLTSTTHRLVC